MNNFNNKEMKDINFVNNLSGSIVNNSILNNAEKTLEHVRDVIEKRGINHRFVCEIPKTFDMIPKTIFSKIQKIDKVYQSGAITLDVAINMIADLFEGEAIYASYEKYLDDLLIEKLKEIYRLFEIRYLDLLDALEKGIISNDEFLKQYSDICEKASNSVLEIIRSVERRRENVRTR